MELDKAHNGVELGQAGLIEELLRKGHKSFSQSLHESLQSTDEDEALLNPLDTEPRGSEETKMLLLNGRTRQDIQYVTSITASRLMKCPDLVSRSGKTAGLPE